MLQSQLNLLQTLAASERPLGVCGVVSQTREFVSGVLLMVGQVATNNTNNNAFVPTSLITEYRVRLCYMALTAGESLRQCLSVTVVGGVSNDIKVSAVPLSLVMCCQCLSVSLLYHHCLVIQTQW